jgi:hypothetical protein
MSHSKSSSSSGHISCSVGTSELKWSEFPFPYSLISSRHGPLTENSAHLLLRGPVHTQNTIPLLLRDVTAHPLTCLMSRCLAMRYNNNLSLLFSLTKKTRLNFSCREAKIIGCWDRDIEKSGWCYYRRLLYKAYVMCPLTSADVSTGNRLVHFIHVNLIILASALGMG